MSEAGEVVGLTEEDPFALKWVDQRVNILRAFLFVWGDDGVDHSAQDLAKMSHEQLVGLCVQTQRDRKGAIDKPWVKTVSEVWEVRGDLDILELWDVGTRDLRALEDLQKKEDALARQQRGRSSSPRQPRNGAKAVPTQDDRWEADDLQPLTLRSRGSKGTEKAGKVSKKGAKLDEHRGGKVAQQAQGDGKGHKKLNSDCAGDGKDVKKKSRSRSRRSGSGSRSRSPSARRSKHQSGGQSSSTASHQSRRGSRRGRSRRSCRSRLSLLSSSSSSSSSSSRSRSSSASSGSRSQSRLSKHKRSKLLKPKRSRHKSKHSRGKKHKDQKV